MYIQDMDVYPQTSLKDLLNIPLSTEKLLLLPCDLVRQPWIWCLYRGLEQHTIGYAAALL